MAKTQTPATDGSKKIKITQIHSVICSTPKLCNKATL